MSVRRPYACTHRGGGGPTSDNYHNGRVTADNRL